MKRNQGVKIIHAIHLHTPASTSAPTLYLMQSNALYNSIDFLKEEEALKQQLFQETVRDWGSEWVSGSIRACVSIADETPNSFWRFEWLAVCRRVFEIQNKKSNNNDDNSVRSAVQCNQSATSQRTQRIALPRINQQYNNNNSKSNSFWGRLCVWTRLIGAPYGAIFLYSRQLHSCLWLWSIWFATSKSTKSKVMR